MECWSVTDGVLECVLECGLQEWGVWKYGLMGYTGCGRYSCVVYHSKNFMFLISLGIIFNCWRRV